MNTGPGIAYLVLILLAAASPAWALEPVGPESEATLQMLREQSGKEPTAEELVGALNRATVGLLRNGKYALADLVAREALVLGERDLGQEHQETLTALNNLAASLENQGRYGEAEPLYQRALEASERILGQDHPNTLGSVNNLAGLYQAQGRYGEAEPLYLRALAARERILGKDHPNTLTSVNNLAGLYRAQGRYGEAEPLLVRALAACERILGQDHPNTLTSTNSLAALYQAQGRYDEAEPLYKRALAARERILGQDHPDTFTSANNLAALYQAQGRYGEAEPLYLRALAACERILGKDHPDTLLSVNNLAMLYKNQGRYSEAEELYLRALAARERILGQDHPQTLISVNNLAALYRRQGRYGEAEQLHVRALTSSERILGQDHPQTLISVNNLAELYRAQGRYGEAEPLYLRALETDEQILGKDHPHTLTSVNNLAELYRTQGRYGEAEPLYLRALAVRERILGKDHPNTLTSVNNLAGLYEAQGRSSEAEPLHLSVLKTRERTLGKDHPDTLSSANNLAALYQAQGRYDEAEPLFVRVFKTNERKLGEEHPGTLRGINNLAMLYQEQGRSSEAEPLYLHVLKASERTLGRDHPHTLTSLNNLAGLYYVQGRYGEAEPLYERAFKAREQMLGEEHPGTLGTRLNLAVTLINGGQRGRALHELRRMDGRLRGFVGNQLATTHREQIRRRWLLTKSNFQQVVFSLALQHPEPDTLRLAADVLLRWKRLAEGSEFLIAQFIRSTEDPKIKETAENLAERRSDLSRLVNLRAPNEGDKSAAHANAISKAIEDIGRLEVELAGLSEEFRDHQASRAVGWEQVRAGLPEGSALLSLRAFRPVDFATGDFGKPHWLALVIPAEPGAGPEILLKDLGTIAPTETTRKKLRATGGKESAQALYQQLFGELDVELAKYDRLYIAADGALDLVPFARLVVPDGRYWVERQALHRIQTGRDLMKFGSDTASATGMIAYGGVDYGETDCPEPEPSSTVKRGRGPSVVGDMVDGDRMRAANRRLRGEGLCFDPLPFTAHEAKAVGQFYWDPDNRKAEVWRGRDASEDRLKSRLKSPASPPRILHLATHGFFLDRKSGSSERPLTLAGVALAGANDGLYGKSSPTGEDGILYALEALELNLAGTELVAFSACDTGRGEVDYSEGVYGLVRAFRIAGARHVLMTLWPLNDRLAYSFMREFYAKWFEVPDRQPAEVLREIQLAWIRSEDSKAARRSNPQYWAPYVLIEGR